jgi:hypothetical protein
MRTLGSGRARVSECLTYAAHLFIVDAGNVGVQAVKREAGICMMRWIMLCRAQLAATILPAGWITMVGGAFLLSLFFLVSFIAAEAWMSRQPMSLRSICSNVLNLYRNRDEITDNERWRQELKNLHDDCSVALYKYDPTSPTYGLTSFDSTRPH